MAVKWKRLRAALRQEAGLRTALSILGALALAGALLRGLNGRLRPVLEAKAASQAASVMAQAIDIAVDDCLQENGMDYSDFITVSTGPGGRVTALTSNTAANSRFKRQVVEAVARQLDGLDSDALGIPLGTLTGQALLSGLGPRVRVRVESVGEVTASYSNTFTAAGVNQTLHRISLDITAVVHLFLPGEILPVTVDSSVCLAETVIVGDTPDTYLDLGKGNG